MLRKTVVHTMNAGPWLMGLCLLIGGPALADPAADLREILTACDIQPDQTCEQRAWSFADVSKDAKLSKAEITRFARLASELEAKKTAGANGTAEVVAFLLGPYGAQIVLDNFDYDGDGFLTKSELFHDAGVAGLKEFAARILASGKSAVELGSVMAGQSVLPSLGGNRASTARPRKRAAASNPQALRHRRFVADQLKSCWLPPDDVGEVGNMRVSLKLTLTPDGSVLGLPKVLNSGGRAQNGGGAQFVAEGARRAVIECGPYDLPADHYNEWRVMELRLKVADYLNQ